MIGTTVSHYRILSEVGRGGMGMVYKAVDTRLDREVALKFLPPGLASDPDAKARFIQEAKAASSLDHANICTVYDIGEADDGRMFIAMALYSGRTLKDVVADGPVSVDQTISIAQQIAGALERAHGRGIVHRDIKPANIMLTDMNEVKILDFGLAKLSGGVDLTKTGSTVGTAAYMSPEQVRALPADFKSDLWSLGVIMYELLTGARPFKGEYDAAVGYSILNETPSSPAATGAEIPIDLEHLIFALLAKEPNERPLGAGDVVSRLNEIRLSIDTSSRANGSPLGTGSVPASESPTARSAMRWVAGFGLVAIVAIVSLVLWRSNEPESVDSQATSSSPVAESSEGYSLAVLPFTDLSAQGELEYFGDGMAEELRNALMGLGGIHVAARASSFFFKGKGASPQAIGDSLSVGLLLEGTIRQVGDNLRVTAELTDTETGFGVWSNRYDEQMDDALSVQDRITREIVAALKLKLDVAASQTPRRQTEAEAEAYRLYLQGKYLMNTRTREGMDTAVTLFKEAVALQPDFALAYAFLSQVYGIQVSWGFSRPKDLLPLAIEAGTKAVELDPNLPDAYAGLAQAHIYNLDLQEAGRNLDRSLELRPDDPVIILWKGMFLANRGNLDEGIELMDKAYELDPLSPIIGMSYLWSLILRGDCEAVRVEYERLKTLHGEHDGLQMRYAECLEHIDRHEEAIALVEPITEDPASALVLGTAYARSGRVDDALRLVERIDSVRQTGYYPIIVSATVYAWLGDIDKAMELFETAFQEKDGWLTWLRTSLLPDELVADPRYTNLLTRVEVN